MKRKETSCEKYLISIGYKLVSKQYKGKNSDKVESYLYEKEIQDIKFCVFLNQKREKVIHSYFKVNKIVEFTPTLIDSLTNISNQFVSEIIYRREQDD